MEKIISMMEELLIELQGECLDREKADDNSWVRLEVMSVLMSDMLEKAYEMQEDDGCI